MDRSMEQGQGGGNSQNAMDDDSDSSQESLDEEGEEVGEEERETEEAGYRAERVLGSVGRGDEEWYDEDEDDSNEEWMGKARRGHESDAILSCPGCLSTVCLDCQRHETYRNQYRAMFAVGCSVREATASKPVQSSAKHSSGEKRKRGGNKRRPLGSSAEAQQQQGEGSDSLQSVRCGVCGTEVAVLDSDDVYHFFNVIPSYS